MQADLRVTIKPGPVTGLGGGGSSSGGGGNAELQNTRTLPLVNPTSFRKRIPQALPEPGSLLNQEDANNYLLRAVKDAMVHVGDTPPDNATEGQLWWSQNDDELTLYIRIDDTWVPASPPVSLDGIETSITGIQGDLIELHNNVRDVKGDVVLTNQDLQALAQDQTRQDEAITTNGRDITQLRSRVGDVEASQGKQDERLDALEAQDQDGGDYIEKKGGTMTGPLKFDAGSRIDANTNVTSLSGRAGLQFRVNADHPVAFCSGSSYKPIISIFGYNQTEPDKAEKTAEIKANGNAFFTDVFSGGKKLATQEYVENWTPPKVEHLDFKSKHSVDPTYARTPAEKQIVGYYENSPGDGSKAYNTYIGNWTHSVQIHINDLQVNGTLPANGSGDSVHRGIFEMQRSNGEKQLLRAVVSSVRRSGDILILNFQGGMNLYGTSECSAESSARYSFYSLI